jgi:hypothetical protein
VKTQASVINRIAAVVTPREPYLSWARSLYEEGAPQIDDVPAEDLTTVSQLEEIENTDRLLRRHWAWIFEEILSSWCADQKLWPRKRTLAMFQQWFETRLVDLVFDLADQPLIREEA